MRKILLLVSACLFAFAATAQKMVNLSVNSWGDPKSYNYQGSVSLSAGEWKSGDVLTVELSGTVASAVSGLQFVIIDQSEAAGWWKELSEYESLGDFEANGSISLSKEITLTSDAASSEKINAVFSTATSSVELEGSVSISFSVFKIEKEGELPNPNAPYEDPILGKLASVWGEGNAVAGKTMTFGESDSGIGFANYAGGFDLSAYAALIVELEEFPTWAEYAQINVIANDDSKVSASFDGSTTAIADLTKLEGPIKQVYLQCGGTGSVVLSSIEFSSKPAAINNLPTVLPIVNGIISSAGTIVVYDVLGNEVMSGEKELNINSLQSGAYIIKAQEGTSKFVK